MLIVLATVSVAISSPAVSLMTRCQYEVGVLEVGFNCKICTVQTTAILDNLCYEDTIDRYR